MTLPIVIRSSEIAPSVWANGRGQTVELFREPRSGPFEWRLSIATITEAAPFSPLPGVSRVLMALDGPLTLIVDGEVRHLERHQTIAFDGGQEVSSTDPGGVQRDFNLMSRGGVPDIQVIAVAGEAMVDAEVVAVVALTAGLEVAGTALADGDTVVTGALPVTIRGAGIVACAILR